MSETQTVSTGEFDSRYAAEQLRRSHHPLRSLVKRLYLNNVLRDVRGPTVDFGCGAGQLLRRLPAGSIGFEINPFLIKSLTADGLTVLQANGDLSDFELGHVESGRFRTLVIAHVLEHLPDPAAALSMLLQACRRVGIERVVVIVPGAKGYRSDITHKTFIDRRYIEMLPSEHNAGFVRRSIEYFPGPWEWVGKTFTFHEMKVLFDLGEVPA